MVAVINTGHSIRSVFNYNENKVSIGTAQCIGEGNYPMDLDQMNSAFRLNFLLKQLELNENVTRNSVHISLNFDPSETGLSKEKLMEIAKMYMTKIGFGSQPYLVYQHHDAGHPHIHIVSIKVKSDGKRIDMQNIGRNQSETARKEIENLFGLVKAESVQKKEKNYKILAIPTGRIQYGKTESKKAISNVLGAVLFSYAYASLPELNAVLRQYNVSAYRGSEDSKIFKTNGLIYRILDEKGKPIGIPIKASDFYFKPTLKFLYAKFRANKTKSPTHAKRIKNLIDLTLLNKKTLPALTKALEKQGINIILRNNDQGILYGITYVDHTTKCVFNGSALGKEYSAKAIQERCEGGTPKIPFLGVQTPADENKNQPMLNSAIAQLIDDLIKTEYVGNYLPNALKKKRKKKKRKGQSDNQ